MGAVKSEKPAGKTGSKDVQVEGISASVLWQALTHMIDSRFSDDRIKNLQKAGHVKFGIFGAGKEAVQTALAMTSRPNDPFLGYYRDSAFCLARGMTTKDLIKEAVSVKNGPSGGRQMPNHFGDISKHILSQTSTTGSHMISASGLADSLRMLPYGQPELTYPEDFLVLATIGDASMREGEVREALDNLCADQGPCLVVVENDFMGISVPAEDSVKDGDPLYLYRNIPGLRYEEIDGTDFFACYKLFTELSAWARKEKKVCIINAKVSRIYNHSSTDDQTKYLKDEDINHNDPITILSKALVKAKTHTEKDIQQLKLSIYNRLSEEADEVVGMEKHTRAEDLYDLIYAYHPEHTEAEFQKRFVQSPSLAAFRKAIPNFDDKNLYRMSDAINRCLIETAVADARICAFGEDVADVPRKYVKDENGMLNCIIRGVANGTLKKERYASLEAAIKDNFEDKLKQKGGVFNITKNLQRTVGDRCRNAPIAEATILGRAIGYAYNGLLPVPEIQFMDYLRPAFQQLDDELATLSFRSNGTQRAPMLIRVSSSGYLGGAGAIWHSTNEMGPKVNRPGYWVVMPVTALDAIGLFREGLYSGDPVLFAEPKARYNATHLLGKDDFFTCTWPGDDFRIPLGKAKLYRKEGTDLTIIAYGNTLPLSLMAAQELEQKGISVQVMDLRTLKPLSHIDWPLIEQCLDKTGKILIADEDREDGGYGQILAGKIATNLDYFERLDAPVQVAATKNSFVPYGQDHANLILLQTHEIVKAAETLAAY